MEKSFQSRRWKGWGREGGKLCMRGVTWVTWCVWGVRPWGMFTSSSDRRDTVLDTILETHPTIPSYSIGSTIPCFPLLSYSPTLSSTILGQPGHCAGHYSGDTFNHTILYYPMLSSTILHFLPPFSGRTLCWTLFWRHTKPYHPILSHNLHEPLILRWTLCYESRDKLNNIICKPRRPLWGWFDSMH